LVTWQAADHFNAEIVSGSIHSKQDAVAYLTWTFFYRRLLQNPSYYDLPDTSADDVNVHLSTLVEKTIGELQVGLLSVNPGQGQGFKFKGQRYLFSPHQPD
jgi:hypothetical protein